MKNLLLTIGGIILAVAIIVSVYFGTFKTMAEDAATHAASEVTNEIVNFDVNP